MQNPSLSADTPVSPDTPVMEIATFRLLPGVSEADFLAAVRATAPILARHRALRARSLTCDRGEWSDIVEWSSLSAAMEAAEAVMADPAMTPLMVAIDPATVQMRHIPIRWQIGG